MEFTVLIISNSILKNISGVFIKCDISNRNPHSEVIKIDDFDAMEPHKASPTPHFRVGNSRKLIKLQTPSPIQTNQAMGSPKLTFRFRRCVGGPEGKQGSNFYPTLSVASFHQRERAPPEFIDTAGFYHYNHTGPSSSAITFSGENTLTASSSSSLQKHSPQKEKKRERHQPGSVRVYFCFSGHTKHTYDVYAANPLLVRSVSFFLSHIYAICTTFDEAGFCCVFRSPFLSLLFLSLRDSADRSKPRDDLLCFALHTQHLSDVCLQPTTSFTFLGCLDFFL